MDPLNFTIINDLVAKVCVVIVLAYLVTRLKSFQEVLDGKLTIKNQLILILIFGAIGIYSTYSGFSVAGAIANTRDLAPMIAGLVRTHCGFGSRTNRGTPPFNLGWNYSCTLRYIHHTGGTHCRSHISDQSQTIHRHLGGCDICYSHGNPAHDHDPASSNPFLQGSGSGYNYLSTYGNC